MAFCYDKLWKLLIDKHMNKVELRDAVGITPATLAKMGKNQNVSMEVLGRICQILDCNIGDIMDYIHEVQEEK
jgi:DNA-binding Xre family transcriptional regulator